MISSRHRLAMLAFGVITTLSAVAIADTDEQRAIVLFDQGRKLAREGRCSEAITPLLESIRHAEGVGPLLNLGACYEQIGKLASAHKFFLRAEAVASNRSDKRRAEAEQRARALEKDLSTIIVHVPVSLRDVAEVQIDGEPLPKDSWEHPTPIDPGQHTIDFVAPPNPKKTDTIAVRGRADHVEWTAPKPTEVSPRPQAPVAAVSALPPPPDSSNVGSTQRMLGVITGGAGLLGLTIGGISGVISLSAHASVTGRCPTYPQCPTSDRASLETMNDNATTAGTVSTISVVAGALLLLGGAALYFTAPKTNESHARR